MQALISVESSRASSETTRGTIQLLIDIFPRIPAHAWAAPPSRFVKNRNMDGGAPYARACAFYKVDPDNRVDTVALSDGTTLVSAFEDLAALSSSFASGILASGSEGSATVRECLMQTMTLLLKLVRRLEKQSATFNLRWEPQQWLAIILGCLDKVRGTVPKPSAYFSRSVTVIAENDIRPC